MRHLIATLFAVMSIAHVCAQNVPTIEASAPIADSNPIKQWTTSFSAIDVDAPIKLKLIKIGKDDAPYIIYDTKGVYTSKFTAETDKNGVLKIRERNDLKRESITEVEVYFNELGDIAISKADTSVEGTLSSPLLDIRISSDAKFVADIDVMDLMIDITGKCRVVLSGKALYQTAEIASAEYDAFDLESMSTVVTSAHNAIVKVNASQRLEAKTATGGKIYYNTYPEILRREIPVFGGEITMTK